MINTVHGDPLLVFASCDIQELKKRLGERGGCTPELK